MTYRITLPRDKEGNLFKKKTVCGCMPARMPRHLHVCVLGACEGRGGHQIGNWSYKWL